MRSLGRDNFVTYHRSGGQLTIEPVLVRRVGNWAQPAKAGLKTPPLPIGPALPGAACKAKAPLFDNRVDKETADQRDQRHADAIELCLSCPVFNQCKPGPDDDGIWRGTLYDRKQRRCPCGTQLPEDVPKGRKYCNDHCRDRYRIRKDRKPPQIRTVTCRCGTVFTTDKKAQIHCSDTCRDAAYHQRRAQLRRIRRLAQAAA